MFVIGEMGWRAVGTAAAGTAGGMAGILTHHRPQDGSLCSVRSTRPWCMTRTVVLRKMKVKILSVRVPMDIRDLDVRDGKMCAHLDESSRLGRGGVIS